jgi:hypothetical protein
MCAPSADELWDQIDREDLTGHPHTPQADRHGMTAHSRE